MYICFWRFFLSGRLDKLKEAIESSGGLIPLAMIKNDKTVDPQDDTSPKVINHQNLGILNAVKIAMLCFTWYISMSTSKYYDRLSVVVFVFFSCCRSL